jgi:hypothetical protein
MHIDVQVQQQFWGKVQVRGPQECWNWSASKNSKGYGQFRNFLAHRFAWMCIHKKIIPEHMIILHNCDNPSCCNPEHLTLGTYEQNNIDRWRRTGLHKMTPAYAHYLNRRKEIITMGETRRILADVPDDFFWEIKRKLADMKLTQKDAFAVALRQFIQSDFPLEQLITDEDNLAMIKAMGIK